MRRNQSTLNIFFLDGSFQSDDREYLIPSGNVSDTINDVFTTTAFDFTFGVPFLFDVRLTSEVSLEESDSGTVTNDFFNTSSLQLLTIGGATGPVTVTSGSGTTYTIPEPSTGLLMMLAATFCLSPRRR